MRLSDCPSPAKNRTLRGIFVAVLVVLWAYGSVALNPMGTPAEGSTILTALGPFVWIGAFCALPCLLAIWAALAKQRLTVRLPRVAGVAALMGLMATWGQIRNTQERDVDIDFVLLVLSVTCLQAIALVPLRRRYGWHVITEVTDSSSGQFQYRLSRLLVWTTAVAVLFGLASWIVADWGRVFESFRNADWLGATIGVLIFAVLTLPLVIPSVALILGDRRRRWYGFWLSVTAALMTTGLYLLFVGTGRAAGAAYSDVLFYSLAVVPMLLGFLSGLLGNLLVMRICGFRLVRRRKIVTAVPV